MFEKLPNDLQHLLKNSEGKTEVDLSNYSFQWLSNDAFQILNEGLHQNKGLRKLILRNCDLSFCFNQKSEQFKNLLRGLNNLETIDLSNNQLCFDDVISWVLKELAHLPRLNKLILQDKHYSAWIPELFEGLRHLPLFRVYEQGNVLCFLNYHEANALMEALRTEEKTAHYFLGEPAHTEPAKKNSSDAGELPKSLETALTAHSNIKTWLTYYKAMSFSPPKYSWSFPSERVSFTPQMVTALRFIDRLRVPGLSLRYLPAKKIFMLDIDQGYAASFEQLMVGLLGAFPFFQKISENYFSDLSTTPKKASVASWQIMLPPFAISQVGCNLLQDVLVLYGNRLTVVMREPPPPKNLEEARKKYTAPTIDPKIVKALTLPFAHETFFYQLTQKETLSDWLNRLKQLFNDSTTKPLVYEFFIVHRLCTVPEIRNLEELHPILAKSHSQKEVSAKEGKNQLAPLDQEIRGLLEANSTTLDKWLTVTLPASLEQRTLPTSPQTSTRASQRISEPEIKGKTRSEFAEEQLTLQARAWLGAIAFHHLTGKTAAAGLYWYGRYLETSPLTETEPPLECSQNSVLKQAKKSGFYWLRLAALRYEHRASRHYLQERANSLRERAKEQKTTIQALLRPADCYQLMLTCEALAPILQHRQLAPPNHLLSLFVEVGNLRDMALELDILYGNRYRDNMFALLLVIASVSKDLITWFMQAGMSREFFKDRTYKNNYLRTMQFYLISLVADNLISESVRGYYLQELAAHHPKSVLAAQLISPPLKEESNAVVRYHAVPLARVITDKLLPLFQMHSNLKVKKNLDEEEAKLKDFCEFFDKHIPQYLAHGRLFNVLINEREDPYFIAAMLHTILNEALVYFGLDNSSFAEKIHETMQDIKSTLDHLGGKHQTALQPTSMGFTATLSQQLESYAATANVANVVKLKLLPKFAASPSEYHLPHQKETSLATKALYGGAALVEVAHFSLPLIVLATGVGLPALLGGGALVQGVRMALENVHPYAEAAEHLFEQNIFINMIPQLAHIHHSVHEAGIFSHEHQEERHQLIEASVLSELNHLVSNASPIHRDAFSMLVRHWDMVYQPITKELDEVSNTLLATLLVELFLRGLNVRSSVERLSHSPKRKLPQTIDKFIEFVEETIWCYSCPMFSDDTLLVTKNLEKSFSALSVIFPNHLYAMCDGQMLSIAISTHARPAKTLYQPCKLARNASVYEIKILNRQLSGETQRNELALQFTFEEERLSIRESSVLLSITYAKINSLDEKISALISKDSLQGLINKVNCCKDHYYLLLSNIERLTKVEGEMVQQFQRQLITLNTILSLTIDQFDDKELTHLTFLKSRLLTLDFLDHHQLNEEAIQLFIEKATAILILLNTKYDLQLPFVDYLALAQKSKEELLLLAGENATHFRLEERADMQTTHAQLSISLSAAALPTNGIFSQNSSTNPTPTQGVNIKETDGQKMII